MSGQRDYESPPAIYNRKTTPPRGWARFCLAYYHANNAKARNLSKISF